MSRPVPPQLPQGVRRVVVRERYRNRGASYGLEHPLVYGWCQDFGCWLVWDRHSGVAVAVFPHVPNVHGWSPAEHCAMQFCDPGGAFDPWQLDSVP